MQPGETGRWDDEALRRFEDFGRRLQSLEEWRDDVRPMMTAMEQLVADADFGKRVRLARAARLLIIRHTILAASAGVVGTVALLKAFGVL